MGKARGLGPPVTLTNWVTRYRLKRPFSRRLRVPPAMLVDRDATPPALARFVADASFDPLAGALGFLFAAHGGDASRARQALARLDKAETARLFRESDLRKLVVACFRRALENGLVGREQAALLLEFARHFDPAFAAPPPPATESPADVLAFDRVTHLSPRLRVAVLYRSLSAPRIHDLGERLVSTFTAAGVTCLAPPSEADPDEIGPADLVLVDEETVFRKNPPRQQAHLDKLRRVARRLGRLVPDPWGDGFQERLQLGAWRYDFFWTMLPTLRDRGTIPPEKFCLIPYPCGFGRTFDDAAATPPEPRLGFCGAIEDYNIHRYVWLLAALARGTDLGVSLTSQKPDGLGFEDSLRLYLGRLLRSAACLSLTMRPTGERILVGRTFDVLRGGRLLVQEATPDARFYLKPGEDFIEVLDPGDLAGLGERIRSGACEPIRVQGADTFRRAYSDEAVVRHLATWA